MIKNEVKILSENSELPFVATWYDLAKDEHFWMQGRLFALLRQLKRNKIITNSPLHGLEIGCGHGILRNQVERHTQWTIDGVDLDLKSLEMNSPSRGEVFLYNVFDKKIELKERYDFIFLYDVIEHIEDVNLFMQACLYHLKQGGFVFINVPAMKSLFSQYDKVVGHVRRYDKNMISILFKENELEEIQINYWGLFFVPLLYIRKLLISRDTVQSTIVKKGFKPTNSFINKVFTGVIKTESKFFPMPLIGTSVMAIAKKS